MLVLGISAYYHDAAASIIQDGVVVAAAQEERFTRKKHDASFPRLAIQSCLEVSKFRFEDIDYVVFYDKPILKFDRLLETYFAYAPKGFSSFSKSMSVWLTDKLFQKRALLHDLRGAFGSGFDERRLLFSEHHLSHAASAFFPSPFEEAAVLTLDGVGEWTTTSVSLGSGSKLEILKELHFPHSLGLLYSAVTYHAGFKVNSGEYKLMGLAPYGTPKYAERIRRELLDMKGDGSFALNMQYFDFPTGLRMTSDRFSDLFDGPARQPESPISSREMDLAASVQLVTEEILLTICDNIRKETGADQLCLAGGVALNCVANGKLLRKGPFKRLWIQPAAGDAGGSVGAALAAYHLALGGKRRPIAGADGMSGTFLGPAFHPNDACEHLSRCDAVFETLEEGALIERTARAIASGKAIGWFSGRMEFGPRSLGARSILADPRSPTMQRVLNLKVKFRESFRPFAPCVLAEDAHEWFDLDVESPYMLLVADVTQGKRCTASSDHRLGLDAVNNVRSEIPAVTHIDYSARVQTVDRVRNPRLHALLVAFKALTGCPVLVNTSFNVRGEPIVNTPTDAFRCFMGTDLDCLVVEHCFLEKSAQNLQLARSYKDAYELD